jgi:DNA-binding transcriptional MocR family regulator
MKEVKASEIRELLKITQQSDFISFGGGLPSPDLFPTEILAEIAYDIIKNNGQQALQYSTTEGHMPLRKHIANRLNEKNALQISAEELLIVNGSQQGLDLVGKLFLNEGDTVFCESPSYLGALSAFRAYGAQFCEVDTDEQGMVPQALEQAIKMQPKGKIIYVVPEFQNPTGRTWTRERRRKIYEVAKHAGVVIVEDNPYGELRYEGETIQPIKVLDNEGLVIYLGTFSKILCPGYRIAWVLANEIIIDKLVLLKQSADLHTSTVNQMQISAYLEAYNIDEHVDQLCMLYKKRRNVMMAAIERYFPDNIKVNKPNGGLFLWITFEDGYDTRELLKRCIAKKVAFVPGDAFYPNHPQRNTCRLNFSNMSESLIEEGIKRMAENL